MANKILLAANSTPIVWADTTDYAGDGGTRTHQILLAALAAAAARQGEKADLDRGDVADRFSHRFSVTVRIEFDVAPAVTGTVSFYWSSSLSATPATANDGACTGADAAYAGSAGSSIEETVLQLMFIGSLPVTLDADTIIQQKTFICTFPTQWGMPVVVNNTAQAFEGDDVEMSITLTPLEDEAQ